MVDAKDMTALERYHAGKVYLEGLNPGCYLVAGDLQATDLSGRGTATGLTSAVLIGRKRKFPACLELRQQHRAEDIRFIRI